MRNILILLIIALSVAGQTPKTKGAPKKEPDPEARYICRIGSYHNCQCPNMIAEVEEDAFRNCQLNSKSDKEYKECARKVPNSCEIIQKEDSKHPQHSCKRTCKKATCQCADTVPCTGPEFGYDYQN